MQDCLFCQLARGEYGTKFLYEDADMVVFRDIRPQAPLHLLVAPKAHIPAADVLTEDDGALLGRMYQVAARLVLDAGYKDGYRVVANVGQDAGQTVPHLHFHILAGRQLAWPPG